MTTYAEEIGILLLDRGLTVGSVESATGGLIAHTFTNVPGSSYFYKGSIVAYSNEMKTNLVGVKPETIEKYGAVSSSVAEEMAAGGRRVLGVDICLSDTGVAGPTAGTAQKPVGTFFIGLSYHGGTYSRECLFKGDRIMNKQSAADEAVCWLKDFLTGTWAPGL